MAKGNKPQQPQQANQAQAKAPKKLSYPTVIHPDLYQRANFTLQASAFLQQLQPEPSTSDVKGKRKATDDFESDIKAGSLDTAKLARNMMAANAKMVVHNQMKLDPSAKRNTCKGCSTVLILGLTAKIRNRPNKYHMNVCHTTCLTCNTQTTIPLPPTVISEGETLDGRKRAQRRRRLATQRMVPFHQREAVTSSTGDEPATKGHTLYRQSEPIHNWGELPPQPLSTDVLDQASL